MEEKMGVFSFPAVDLRGVRVGMERLDPGVSDGGFVLHRLTRWLTTRREEEEEEDDEEEQRDGREMVGGRTEGVMDR